MKVATEFGGRDPSFVLIDKARRVSGVGRSSSRPPRNNQLKHALKHVSLPAQSGS